MGLLAVVVYLYTVVAFNFFRKFYNKSEDGDMPDMKCDDMLTVSLFLFFSFLLSCCGFVLSFLSIGIHTVMSLASRQERLQLKAKGQT